MHKDFLELLEKATGRSEHVIAVNFDIRGFTPFCATVDSLSVATYITRVYLKTINDYFKNASFYKPTGDGLIIILPFERKNLREVANLTMNSCLSLLENFSSLCIYDPMINYPTPQKIGIGVARGSACCITSEDKSKVLDYSGRLLNLASRLMDLARPSGIVFDESFGINLLSDETKKLFSEEIVFVRGVAEENPIRIYYTSKHTLIPDLYRHPLKEPRWNADERIFQFEHLYATPLRHWFTLSKKPLDKNKITVKISFPNPRQKGFELFYEYSIDNPEISYKREGNKHRVAINFKTIRELLETQEVTKDMKVRIEITYPIKV